MTAGKGSDRFWFYGTGIIVGALFMRLVSLGFYPLMDTSEARYGEIVRLMVETNDWITPYFDYDVPFWGKPPLFIWMSAISFKLFGINEFAARFPSLITSLGTLWLTWRLASFQLNHASAKLAVLILTSCAMFLVLSGALLADPVMVFSITLTLSGFWIGLHSTIPGEARRWQTLFFVGAALTLLSKGLVGLVLAGLPVFFWCLFRRQFGALWKGLPWLSGTLLTAFIALPWFIAAELKTPGMLEYMIIGEHFSRYLEEGWSGDNYGNAHIRPLGTIWYYFLLGGFPWSLVLTYFTVRWLWRRFKHPVSEPLSEWGWFLTCWAGSLLVFFTFASNMIWTYALPMMPPLALAVTAAVGDRYYESMFRRLLALATITPVLMAITIYILINDGGKASQKAVIQAMHNESVSQPGELLYYQHRPFSSRFYSHGKARKVESASDLSTLIDNGKTDFLVTEHQDTMKQLPTPIQQRFHKVFQYRKWILWRENRENNGRQITIKDKEALE